MACAMSFRGKIRVPISEGNLEGGGEHEVPTAEAGYRADMDRGWAGGAVAKGKTPSWWPAATAMLDQEAYKPGGCDGNRCSLTYRG